MRRHVATIVTLVTLGAALWWVTQGRGGSATEEEPQSVVWRMIDESKAGNVENYLDCFMGEVKDQLEGTPHSGTEQYNEGCENSRLGRSTRVRGCGLLHRYLGTWCRTLPLAS